MYAPYYITKMFLNKKSGVSAFLIGLIIFLVVVVILLMFYARTFDIFKSKQDKNICAAAVRIKAALKIKGSDMINTLFKSPTESLSIYHALLFMMK